MLSIVGYACAVCCDTAGAQQVWKLKNYELVLFKKDISNDK
jgi:hypothetical protein